MINYFKWSDFDKGVEHIANECKFLEFAGIYGVPRGGLCLAVALSHKLKINLISEPKKNSLILDDVYETGITLNTFKDIDGAMFFVLFSKIKPTFTSYIFNGIIKFGPSKIIYHPNFLFFSSCCEI